MFLEMRTAVANGADVDVRGLRESPTQAEGISVRGVGGCILLGRRNRNLPEEGEKILYDMQLVTLEDGEVCLGVYRNQENEWWTRRQQGEEWYTNKHDVVVWQPLPEPIY